MVTIEMENGKKIEIELSPDSAPNTVANFKSLVAKGYYNGLIFHRVISGFMIQGGCPRGTGTGGPGYSIKGEFRSHVLYYICNMLLRHFEVQQQETERFFRLFCKNARKGVDGGGGSAYTSRRCLGTPGHGRRAAKLFARPLLTARPEVTILLLAPGDRHR
jgi:hypothetical protein